MKTANSGLQAVEYLFIAISMMGIAIATFTQEVTYAAIPLMITVLLSVFNRQEVEANILLLEKKLLDKEQEVEPSKDESSSVNYSEEIKNLEAKSKDTEGAIIQLKQDYQQLLSSFYDNNLTSQITDFQRNLSSLQERFEQFNSLDLSPIQDQINTLQQRIENFNQAESQGNISELKTQINDLQERLKSNNSVDLSSLEQQITKLQQQLDSFAQVYSEITQLRQNQETLEGNLQEYKTEINQVFNLIQSLPHRSELEELKQAINSLIYLKTEVNKFVNWESFNSLSSQFNNLVEQFNHRPEAKTFQDLSESLSKFNFQEIEAQIKHLREQFETIPQKDLIDTLNSQGNDLNKIKEQLEIEEEQKLSSQSRINPELRKRILKSKPRRVRINQRRR